MNQKGFAFGETGFAHIFLILFLLAGLAVGVYLVQQKTNIFPKASGPTVTTPTTSFELSPANSSDNYYNVGDLIPVNVRIRSDISAANLFNAKITFDKDLLAVDNIRTDNSFVKNWVENTFDNNAGTISLVGGVPTPGYKTDNNSENQKYLLMAIIHFKVLKSGSAAINLTDDSAIYSNADNINILAVKTGAVIKTGTGEGSPTPASSNLVLNGGFEDGFKGWPEAVLDSDVKYSGNYSAKVTYTGIYWGAGVFQAMNLGGHTTPQPDDIFVSPKELLCLSARVKLKDKGVPTGSPGMNRVDVAIDFSDVTNNLLYQQAPRLYANLNTTDWQLVRETVTNRLDQSVVLTQVEGSLRTTTDTRGNVWTGTVWFDDFSLTRGACSDSTSFPASTSVPSPSVVPTATMVPVAKSTPVPGKGDGNNDGKVDLIDLSILLSDFGKADFRPGIDVNEDKAINVFDVLLLRKLLIEKGVIKGS